MHFVRHISFKLSHVVRPGLTLRQNKHLLEGQQGTRGTTEIRPQGNLFYQQYNVYQKHPKIKNKNVGKMK